MSKHHRKINAATGREMLDRLGLVGRPVFSDIAERIRQSPDDVGLREELAIAMARYAVKITYDHFGSIPPCEYAEVLTDVVSFGWYLARKYDPEVGQPTTLWSLSLRNFLWKYRATHLQRLLHVPYYLRLLRSRLSAVSENWAESKQATREAMNIAIRTYKMDDVGDDVLEKLQAAEHAQLLSFRQKLSSDSGDDVYLDLSKADIGQREPHEYTTPGLFDALMVRIIRSLRSFSDYRDDVRQLDRMVAIFMRRVAGATSVELAREYGITKQRVDQLYQKAILIGLQWLEDPREFEKLEAELGFTIETRRIPDLAKQFRLALKHQRGSGLLDPQEWIPYIMNKATEPQDESPELVPT